jgi:arsenate reductase
MSTSNHWFSKTYDDEFNPKSEFDYDVFSSGWRLSFIAGAEKRIPITYEDPKAFDNTPNKQKYQERSLQIATEMFYVFSQIKSE